MIGTTARQAKILRQNGMHLNEIAKELDISRQRVDQIVNPIKTKARKRLSQAVKTGKINRPEQCENCSVPCKPSGHHADYSKPLDVAWLCTKCHARIDMDIKEPFAKSLNIRTNPLVYDKLQRLADSQFRSMNSTVTLAILEKWERDMEKK